MDKKLIEQLHTLKNCKPDPRWKESNKELLMSQIYSSSSNEVTENGFFMKFSFLRNIPQPAMAAFLIFAVLLSSGVLSLSASKNAVPGDSLYIAKKLNEKAKLAITFNEKKKTRLSLEFAQNRVEEIHEILKDEKDEKKEEAVNNLVDEVRKEIQIAKNKMGGEEEKGEAGMKDLSQAKEEGTAEEADSMVFSAGLEKEDKGLQVSGMEEENVTDPELSTETEEGVKTKETEEVAVTAESETLSSSTVATSSADDTKDSATSSEASEATEEDEDIMKAINALEADLESTIERIDSDGEVKGVSEDKDASSSEEVVE